MEKLTSEIISLIHHVKLNESGWWSKAIQNIIVSIFGMKKNSPLSNKQVYQIFKSELNFNLKKAVFEREFSKLISKKEIIQKENEYYELTEEKYEEFKTAYDDQRKLELNSKKRFFELSEKYCPQINKVTLWTDLNEKLLIPLIKEIGARTYELLSGSGVAELVEYKQFHDFLERYDEDKSDIRAIIINFLDFRNEPVKKLLLSQLIAYFFVEATNLNQTTLEKIYSLSRTNPNLKVFVDTNFLLTLLNLHDNPSNEATLSLLELLEEIKKKVQVNFYVFPITVKEFRNLISRFKDQIKNMKPSLNYARVIDSIDEFSGIMRKFFEICAEKKRIIDPEKYFDPYLDNLTVLFRDKGIELQNENVDKYSGEQKVIDDLNDQVDYRFKKYKNNGKYNMLNSEDLEAEKIRIYDKFKHDCILWHIVKDKRPEYIDSPKDIKHWIITLDFGFLEFDKYKHKTEGNTDISVCLHPNELISMLQFWVPRTEKFEKAMLGNFRLPFLFRQIDAESERVSIEILSALSEYEGSPDFSKELISEILTNKALRQKIKVSNKVEQNAELIKEEIFRKYEESKRNLRITKSEKIKVENKLESLTIEVSRLSSTIEKQSSQKIKNTETQLDILRKSRISKLENEKNILETKLESVNERIKDFDDLSLKASSEVAKKMKGPRSLFLSFFVSREQSRKRVENEVYSKYFDVNKYESLKRERKELEEKINTLIIPNEKEKVIVFCENQNSHILNLLGFENISFFPEKDSASVYIKTVSNPASFGIRDRDFLTDNEIEKIENRHPNYKILKYYCFENFLYHPDNLEELKLAGFEKELYVEEILKQRQLKYEEILTRFREARRGYQEFNIKENKLMDSDVKQIIENLKSEDIEVLFKSYSMKDWFNKSSLEKFNLSKERLSSTEWFKNQISEHLSNFAIFSKEK
jgi:hypothetical protein